MAYRIVNNVELFMLSDSQNVNRLVTKSAGTLEITFF